MSVPDEGFLVMGIFPLRHLERVDDVKMLGDIQLSSTWFHIYIFVHGIGIVVSLITGKRSIDRLLSDLEAVDSLLEVDAVNDDGGIGLDRQNCCILAESISKQDTLPGWY